MGNVLFWVYLRNSDFGKLTFSEWVLAIQFALLSMPSGVHNSNGELAPLNGWCRKLQPLSNKR